MPYWVVWKDLTNRLSTCEWRVLEEWIEETGLKYFFPLSIKIAVLYSTLSHFFLYIILTAEFHPGYLVCDVLKEIASCTTSCIECLCKVSGYFTLTCPISHWSFWSCLWDWVSTVTNCTMFCWSYWPKRKIPSLNFRLDRALCKPDFSKFFRSLHVLRQLFVSFLDV